MPYEGGGTKQSPYGSPDIRARVRDVGTVNGACLLKMTQPRKALALQPRTSVPPALPLVDGVLSGRYPGTVIFTRRVAGTKSLYLSGTTDSHGHPRRVPGYGCKEDTVARYKMCTPFAMLRGGHQSVAAVTAALTVAVSVLPGAVLGDNTQCRLPNGSLTGCGPGQRGAPTRQRPGRRFTSSRSSPAAAAAATTRAPRSTTRSTRCTTCSTKTIWPSPTTAAVPSGGTSFRTTWSAGHGLQWQYMERPPLCEPRAMLTAGPAISDAVPPRKRTPHPGVRGCASRADVNSDRRVR